MEDSSSQQAWKSTRALIGIIIAIIFIIVTISVAGAVLAKHEEANIVNEYDTKTDVISSTEMTNVKKELYSVLKDTSGADHDFDAVVRWDTVRTNIDGTGAKSFLVDIDEYEQTFQVLIDGTRIDVNCPEVEETKYPESYCIGNGTLFDDSIGIVFKNLLPYEGRTNEGEYFTIARNEDLKDLNDRYLNIIVTACPFDDATKERVNQAVDDIIISLGASPQAFRRTIVSGGICENSQ